MAFVSVIPCRRNPNTKCKVRISLIKKGTYMAISFDEDFYRNVLEGVAFPDIKFDSDSATIGFVVGSNNGSFKVYTSPSARPVMKININAFNSIGLNPKKYEGLYEYFSKNEDGLICSRRSK